MSSNPHLTKLWSNVKSQRFAPTERKIGKNWVEKYNRKDFNQANLLEVFHENTKLGKRREFERRIPSVLFNETEQFVYVKGNVPEYPGHEEIELPEPSTLDASLGTVIRNRRSSREMRGDGLSLEELSTILEYTCGVTETKEADVGRSGEHDDGTIELSLRAYPSGGGLYSVRPYLFITNRTDELDPGLYFYVPEAHALRVLKRDEELAERVEDDRLFVGPPKPGSSELTFVLTARFWRAMAKYGPRCYRIILQESGHLAQNALLVAEALGFAAVPLNNYNDDPVNEYLGINGVDEAVIHSVAIGRHR